MKKTIALLMAGMMTVACASVSYAEEPAFEVDYTMIDESVYEGTWITAFDVFDLYLPSDWDVLVNAEADEEPEDSIYFQAANEDQTRSVAITYAQTEDLDFEKLAETYTEQGLENVMFATINEIPVVTYEVKTEEAEVSGIATIGDMGGLYTVTIGCVPGDEEFQAIGQNIIFSFSATEYEYETEADTEA